MPSITIRRKVKEMKLTSFLELSNSNQKPDKKMTMLFLTVTESPSRFIFYNCLINPLYVMSAKHTQHTYSAKIFNERVTDSISWVRTIRKHF